MPHWIRLLKPGVAEKHPGLRSQLIALFVVIKVLPLILLAWIAWTQASALGQLFLDQATRLSALAHKTVNTVGEISSTDSVKALDARAREDIERLTTDTAQRIATFLYARDSDAHVLAALEPSADTYQKFIDSQRRSLIRHGDWQLAPDQESWQTPRRRAPGQPINFEYKENTRELHYRPPEHVSKIENRPLYLEITYVDLSGKEQIKATSSTRMPSELKDVAEPRNTYVRAENYFQHLKNLKPGEIHVSDVIGAYVGSRIIGHYTPAAARKAGIEFRPELAAYAGKENPKGRRFKGLIRWATPVVRDGKITGYVTLALDHDHIMEFTDRLVPTSERYSEIADASTGNYAFIWDHLGRAIAHPRHHSIPGYDPATGEPVPSWLEDRLYNDWKRSGKSYRDFIKGVPTFREQGLDKKFAREQIEQEHLGLDCRYLNFAPQCKGWFDVTSHGGSGSFLILWSGLWKLTTAAAIPYHTGPYGKTPRGFGIVTIGANVDEFHAAANATKIKIDETIQNASRDMESLSRKTMASVDDSLQRSAFSLVASTALMILVVILIAIWIASYLTSRITALVHGIARFRHGDLDFRFKQPARDEMSQLASSFDKMADDISRQLENQENEIIERQRSEQELISVRDHLEEMVSQRTDALLQANSQLQVEISERRLAEQQALHVAEHDPLTGLANRDLFRRDLVSAIEQASYHNKMVAVLFFDLDKFKDVNDTLGHTAGDHLLCAVAQTICGSIRSRDTVARLGGDEFAVIASQIETPVQAERIAQSILDRLGEPIDAGGNHFFVGISIGISLLSADNADAEVLVQQADVAMYQAKSRGGNCYQFFEDDMHRIIMARTVLETELRTAVQESQFCLHYQPRNDFLGSRLVGVEALLRWQHPERGLLPPGAFLDVAALSNILPSIDNWVLTAVCRQGADWLRQGFNFERIAINVAPTDLVKPGYWKQVVGTMSEYGLAANKLEIEITESALIRQYDIAIENLRELRQRGCHIAIDDFGMEHSSLQRLIECPINVIKIDRYFVSRIGEIKSEAVIAAVVAMAHSIRLDLIAEGVETQKQQQFLAALGCHVVQGYLYARPMPPDQLVDFIGHPEQPARHL